MSAVTDNDVRGFIDQAVETAKARIATGQLSQQLAVNWIIAETNVRRKNQRKDKGWSEARIIRKARLRFVFRSGWDVLSGIMPQPFDGALVDLGNFVEGIADDIIAKIQSEEL